ncbi:uncharacterized protein LOC141620956 [Silene latifolia]|uniref:uncharacterized protein LOC141620956 n=1 Tax=Silene latifolia TaxID=37657 RepID=UPI003D7781FF
MATPESSDQETLFSPYDDPLFLSTTEQHGLRLTENLFDGTNFRQWQREVIQTLLSKNKIGFISGECAITDKNDKRYNSWIRCDLFVSRWIRNSMVQGLRDHFQYANSSKHLWSEIVERFGQLNVLELYELKKELVNLKQENASLIDYYTKIKGLWENIDHMDPIPHCTCGVMSKCTCSLLKRLVERETQAKLIQLLMSLHAGYEQVQSSLLSMDPLPPINKALGVLQKIERQKTINNTDANPKGKRPKESTNPYPPCKQCGKTNHKVEDCFQLQTCLFCEIKGHIIDNCYSFKAWKAKQAKGKAKTGDSARPPHKPVNNAELCGNQDVEYASVPQTAHCANINPFYPTALVYTPTVSPTVSSYSPAVQSVPTSQSPSATDTTTKLSPDLVQGIVDSVMNKVLQALNDRTSTASVDPGSQSYTHFAGKSSTQFTVGFIPRRDWVIDTGASDHMTSDVSLLHDIKKLQSPLFVSLPDGSVKTVYHTGNVFLTKDITLLNVLLISGFKPNLLSVAKLITSSQLIVTFLNDSCLFQDHSSKALVAKGVRIGDLYKLRASNFVRNTLKPGVANAVQTVNVAFLHARLGHSSVEKLRHVNKTALQGVNKLYCDTCVLAKHHSLPFYKSLSYAAKCFDLIHMDLWGLL